MLIWTAQKLQNTKHNSGSAFPDIITGFGFQNAVDGCSRGPEPNASSDSHESQSSAQATTAQHLFIHNRPRLWNRNLGLCPPSSSSSGGCPRYRCCCPQAIHPCTTKSRNQCLKQLRDISKSLSNGFQLRFWIRCSSTTCFFSVPTSSSSCFHIRSPKLRCTAECTGFWCPRYGRRSRICHSRPRSGWCAELPPPTINMGSCFHSGFWFRLWSCRRRAADVGLRVSCSTPSHGASSLCFTYRCSRLCWLRRQRCRSAPAPAGAAAAAHQHQRSRAH